MPGKGQILWLIASRTKVKKKRTDGKIELPYSDIVYPKLKQICAIVISNDDLGSAKQYSLLHKCY